METGNGDQVGEAIGAKYVPVAIVETTRVAQGKGTHESRGRMVERGDAPGHVFAPCSQAISRREQTRLLRLTQIAAGGDALRQRMPLAVQTAGIAQAARCAQAAVHPPCMLKAGTLATAGRRSGQHGYPRSSLAQEQTRGAKPAHPPWSNSRYLREHGG